MGVESAELLVTSVHDIEDYVSAAAILGQIRRLGKACHAEKFERTKRSQACFSRSANRSTAWLLLFGLFKKLFALAQGPFCLARHEIRRIALSKQFEHFLAFGGGLALE